MLGNQWVGNQTFAADGESYAHSDSNKRYLHHIDLYDVNNRKITADSDQPYSTLKTCGRCHDYATISHGWHFNAFASDARRQAENGEIEIGNAEVTVSDGRPGEPWIWTDIRTGTQLPLSYRDWLGRFNPTDIGLSTFEMTRQFGARLPGGNMATPDKKASQDDEADRDKKADADDDSSRWVLTGYLEIDCMACHATSGAYDFELRRETIEAENFAWAPTAALRLGDVSGSVSRIKTGSDPSDEAVQAKLPKVKYRDQTFAPDGTVFFDLVREPENNACYQCHSQRTVTEDGIEPRWTHDEDVHLRAGMNCSDCHRNGIDHQTVRGFPGEQHPSGNVATTLSCAGCHLGTESEDNSVASISSRPGRLGSPLPKHEGLPPIHFEKLTCIACHGGPAPDQEADGILTSLSHGLGQKLHRDGQELPSIRGPLFARSQTSSPHADNESDHADESPITTARAMWPAYWGSIKDGIVSPLSPEAVYSATRKALRVRKDFVAEVSEKGREEFDEKVFAALAAIEKEFSVDRAVYVSTGAAFARGEQQNSLTEVDVKNVDAIEMVQWPMAHNVRPAGWALGATGCLECHVDNGLIFASTVTPTGPAPVVASAISMSSIQQISDDERSRWNQLFAGRATFKLMTAVSLALMAITLLGTFIASTRPASKDSL
nr:multiheme c-type cytochrome [Rubripirellula reticaptiva]